MAAPEEFYVGYEHPMPRGLARRVRSGVIVLSAAAIFAGMLYASGFRELPASRFAFGHPTSLEGTLHEQPHPTLVVRGSGQGQTARTYLLVAPGKHGAGALVRGLDGKDVTLRGALAQRGDSLLLEVVPGSIREVRAAATHDALGRRSLGRQTLRGEIVDSKCFLGVMNPGERKVHRDCAIRCILGGIPPAFVVRDRRGSEALLLIETAAGVGAGPDLAPLAGLPVEVTGDVYAGGDSLWLRADLGAFRRLDR